MTRVNSSSYQFQFKQTFSGIVLMYREAVPAKAAGIKGEYGFDDVGECIFYVDDNDCGHWWNPRDNSGDSFELAVKLGISITPYPIYNTERHSVIAKQRRQSDTLRERNPTEFIELYGDDPCAATRLAILRTAA